MAINLSALSPGGAKNKDESAPSDATILEADKAAPPATPAAGAKKADERPVSERMKGHFIVFGLLVIATVVLLVMQNRQATNATLYVASAGELQMLSQQIAKAAQRGIQGDRDAFTELRTASQRFSGLLGTLTAGGTLQDRSVPASPESVQPALATLAERWRSIEQDVGWLLDEETSIATLDRSVAMINAFDPLLYDLTVRIARAKVAGNASDREILLANEAVLTTQRIAKNANSLLAAETIDPEAAFQMSVDPANFNDTLSELLRLSFADPQAQQQLRDIEWYAEETLAAVGRINDNIQNLVQAKQTGARMFEASPALLEDTRSVSAAYDNAYRGFDPLIAGIVACGVLALAVIALIVKAYNADLTRRRAEAEHQRLAAEEERNLAQQAILRLMNEMGDLADGDLTVRATVSEDITGAIADSVNYTVEELSVLVRRINDAATRVTAATESAQKISGELLDATERQSQEIEEVGSTVERMAEQMTESSERVLQSAQVARQSRDAAQKGTTAVEDTIRGMNDIREQIQETSKRIKRLGESSQEIGEIVELISDITEQTNVLALNAAIQAASAGEAGRGFTVVAEEVQRLAERSAEATKQIASIVKSIQTDTKDAVSAMETATRDVVEGAQLTDAAGQVLVEIERVSTETAELIEQISSDIQNHAATAGRVAGTMKDILAITDQTTRGTQQTAVSVGQLADLAVELKGSVSGFKV
ncbi:methyl-accepting chemotaxis protein [Pseudazoarcus pumilus]|uniref:Chemotaxis protein n=1 Tax=Pseudazoarcus pumilus TaxID=2067960 RepID=A0A2I6S3X0_9RHOO|nr:methyl-accepting chemotaxis protein [Pseudazoarcus pumilus]AUN93952.1 chemotaxis protein [Pseudazoarcus pumilus]